MGGHLPRAMKQSLVELDGQRALDDGVMAPTWASVMMTSDERDEYAHPTFHSMASLGQPFLGKPLAA